MGMVAPCSNPQLVAPYYLYSVLSYRSLVGEESLLGQNWHADLLLFERCARSAFLSTSYAGGRFSLCYPIHPKIYPCCAIDVDRLAS